jgi:toxin YoeB
VADRPREPQSGDVSSRRPARAVIHSSAFDQDLTHWITTERRIALRVMQLSEAIRRDPFAGIGKPEPLKSISPNTWSRRITDEHRLVYQVFHDRIVLLRARGHYE